MQAKITIVGLGSGDESQLTLGVWRLLEQKRSLYVRTATHPVVKWLIQQGIECIAFDNIYEAHDDFSSVYQAIVDQLLEAVREKGEVIYGVPGHPMVAEATVRMLIKECKQHGFELDMIGGESFLDQAFLRLGFDPIEGFQLFDAARIEPARLRPDVHTLVTQVYDQFTASDVKLSLMERFPDDHPVVVAHKLGMEGEHIEQVPLYELDRSDRFGNWSLVWVPASEDETLRNRDFERLHEIVRILRSPEGCPWDRAQTHESIRKNLIEEMYEVLDTIDDNDAEAMCEELGDLLLQIMLHAQMEEEQGTFNVYDVIEQLNEKLIRRHPHVFGDREAGDPDEALANWQAIKDEEKRKKGIDVSEQSVLSGIPRHLPAMMRAYELQKKAAKVGFDWEDISGVFAKIEEELSELKEACSEAEERKREELGDLLFAVINLARFLKLDPEHALALTNRKFEQRFTYIEEQLRLRGSKLEHTSLTEMEKLWQEAKN